MSTSVDLRELCRSAGELVRRVELGEEFVITVAGRPAARLTQSRPARWRRWSDVDELFRGPADAEWAALRRGDASATANGGDDELHAVDASHDLPR